MKISFITCVHLWWSSAFYGQPYATRNPIRVNETIRLLATKRLHTILEVGNGRPQNGSRRRSNARQAKRTQFCSMLRLL